MEHALIIVLVLTGLGAVFGLVLAYANKKLAIEVNPLIHVVEDVLPKGQCGACGFAGCMAYAEAVVTNPDVPPNLCIPGKEPVAKLVAELTGKAAAPVEPVPELIVSPAPRSQNRTSMVCSVPLNSM